MKVKIYSLKHRTQTNIYVLQIQQIKINKACRNKLKKKEKNETNNIIKIQIIILEALSIRKYCLILKTKYRKRQNVV